MSWRPPRRKWLLRKARTGVKASDSGQVSERNTTRDGGPVRRFDTGEAARNKDIYIPATEPGYTGTPGERAGLGLGVRRDRQKHPVTSTSVALGKPPITGVRVRGTRELQQTIYHGTTRSEGRADERATIRVPIAVAKDPGAYWDSGQQGEGQLLRAQPAISHPALRPNFSTAASATAA